MSLSDKKIDIGYENCRMMCGQRVWTRQRIRESIEELKEKLMLGLKTPHAFEVIEEVFGPELTQSGEDVKP